MKKSMTLEEIIREFGIKGTTMAKAIGMSNGVFKVYMHKGFPAKHQEKMEKYLKSYSAELEKKLSNYKRKY